MKPIWRTYLLYGSVIIVVGILTYILIETIRAKNTGFETKTLWDWMELLVIPLVLGFGAYFLSRAERNNERNIATDRQQEAALQSYLDRMEDLLLREKLRVSENEEVRNVARIRTLTVLRGLDARRKGFVIQFLSEAELITGLQPIVGLEGADLRGANLFHENLSEVNLNGSLLIGANLGYAELVGAYLQAPLNGANLLGAKLANAKLMAAFLNNVDLELADLRGANLQGAALYGANLKNADLSDSNLIGAYVSPEQLSTARALKGATMPDGTIHD